MNILVILLASLGYPASIEPGEVLAIGPAPGRGGRATIAADPIQAAIASGRWAAPKAGEKAADGDPRTWTSMKVGDDGAFSGPSMRGGYAFAPIASDADRPMILEASGHAMVYVNGEPRVGDPYSHGYVRVPVMLRKGENSLLFATGRGTLRFKLVEPRAAAMIEVSDPTLPDLIVDREAKERGAVVVLNASPAPLEGASIRAEAGGEAVVTPLPTIPPMGLRKVGFAFEAPAGPAGSRDLKLGLLSKGRPEPIDAATLKLGVVAAGAAQKRTFLSGIDGSVQYYGLVPASGPSEDGPKGLILTLHGASVEGIGQARVYAPRPWAHVVAPTNRRPYGFDWEDWGRLDAIEVLDLTQAALKVDPSRVYLTGHSMGGHGTWHVGVTFPDRFAAIAPSAGWVSMFSYAGAKRPENPDPVAAIVGRAALPSDTLRLSKNLKALGVYILHGDADDNVPVSQARTMRKDLAEFHPDFAYHEQPGAGHWWGNECCDWPPLMAFLERRIIPGFARRVDFTTAHPGVSARAHWATIAAQIKAFEPSAVHLDADPDARTVRGTTENVRRLAIDVSKFKPGGPIAVEIDGAKLSGLSGPVAWLKHDGAAWTRIDPPSPAIKGPARSGPFKDAFRHRFLMVYGTKGTPEENAWSFAKARFDAESFWYRGNGSVDVIPDTHFDPNAEPDRGVILYGNADTNAAWTPLIGDGPVKVGRGSIRVGPKEWKGDGLACLFVRPRPGSDRASVAAVSATGLPGFRATDRLSYLSSGVAYPDLIILGPEALTKGAEGIVAAGYFGDDWGFDPGEFSSRGGEAGLRP